MELHVIEIWLFKETIQKLRSEGAVIIRNNKHTLDKEINMIKKGKSRENLTEEPLLTSERSIGKIFINS